MVSLVDPEFKRREKKKNYETTTFVSEKKTILLTRFMLMNFYSTII